MCPKEMLFQAISNTDSSVSAVQRCGFVKHFNYFIACFNAPARPCALAFLHLQMCAMMKLCKPPPNYTVLCRLQSRKMYLSDVFMSSGHR